MSSAAGPLMAAALLLAAAGALKMFEPAPTRVALRTAGLPGTALVVRGIAAGEIAVATYTIGWGGQLAAALTALIYLGFAAFSWRVMTTSRGRASCGCFGASDAPITRLHVGVNLVVVAVGIWAMVDPVAGVARQIDATPLAGLPFLAFTVMLAWLLQVALTTLPELQAAATPRRRRQGAAQ